MHVLFCVDNGGIGKRHIYRMAKRWLEKLRWWPDYVPHCSTDYNNDDNLLEYIVCPTNKTKPADEQPWFLKHK